MALASPESNNLECSVYAENRPLLCSPVENESLWIDKSWKQKSWTDRHLAVEEESKNDDSVRWMDRQSSPDDSDHWNDKRWTEKQFTSERPAEKRLRWKSTEALEIKFDDGCGELGDCTEIERVTPEGRQAHPSLCSNISTDSGCESEAIAEEPESVYSTVTSCNSDLVRMQLIDSVSDELEEKQQTSVDEFKELVESKFPIKNEEEFRGRSWSLNPRILILEENDNTSISSSIEEQFPLRHAHSEPQLSASSSTNSMPICRICHMSGDEPHPLISPCRCAGTMKYVHTGCLMRWLEISSRRRPHPPSCELCHFPYLRHKRFRVGGWHLPTVNRRDKILHVIFVINIIVMFGAGAATVLCFKQDSGKRSSLARASDLTYNEILTLICGILFFSSFFIAMYVEVKAHSTLYRLFNKFIYLNQQWYIDEYDPKNDKLSVDRSAQV